MLAGVGGFNGMFLADLANDQNKIAEETQQISSGIRVNQASDDPSAVGLILDYQNSISQITQVQTNLSTAQTAAQTADGVLQTANSLLNQLISIATEGASSTTSASSKATLAQQVQGIGQQLADIANNGARQIHFRRG